MSMDLGANDFIDFRLTKDLVKDIKDTTGGEGVNAAVITAANVGSNSCYLPTFLRIALSSLLLTCRRSTTYDAEARSSPLVCLLGGNWVLISFTPFTR